MAKTSIHPIYVIAGKEQALAKKQYHDLLDRLLPADQHATGLWVTDSKAQIDEVLDEVRTLPFLTDRRVVVVQEADEFITRHRPLLETYFDKPCASGVLILMAASFPSNTKLAKKLKQVGELINITPPKPWQLPAHMTQYVKQAFDKTLARDAAQLLVDLTGDDVTRLYSEAEKLVVFVDEKRNISIQDVEALVGHNRVFGVFEVIDAMVAGQTGTALQRLRNMFAEDKNAQYTVVGAFAFHVRKMFNAKAMLNQGKNIPEVTKALRIWGKTDLFYAQIRKVSLEQISRIIQQLANIDHQIKTGQTRPEVAIEQLVLNA
ncbi:MAG: DNA polymerase III subunit delta [Phycisphaerae bacterium]|nr:DNA polymerase III subunit delta [Phycisphaerae bacterium]